MDQQNLNSTFDNRRETNALMSQTLAVDIVEGQTAVKNAIRLAKSINENKFNRHSGKLGTQSVFFSPQHSLRSNAYAGGSTFKNRSATVEGDAQQILKQMSLHKLRFQNGETLDLTQADLIQTSPSRGFIPFGYIQERTPIQIQTQNKLFNPHERQSIVSNKSLNPFQRKPSNMGAIMVQHSQQLPEDPSRLHIGTISTQTLILPQLSQRNFQNKFQTAVENDKNLSLDFPMKRDQSNDFLNFIDGKKLADKTLTRNVSNSTMQDMLENSRDQISKILQKRIRQVVLTDDNNSNAKLQKEKLVTINALAQITQSRSNMSTLDIVSEDRTNQAENNVELKVTITPQLQVNTVSTQPNKHDLTLEQVKEMKRQKKKEREMQRRERDKLRHEERVRLGFIQQLTKEEAQERIRFFTIAAENRRNAEKLLKGGFLDVKGTQQTSSTHNSNLQSPTKRLTQLHQSSSQAQSLNIKSHVDSEKKLNEEVLSEENSVLYTDINNPNFKFRIKKLDEESNIMQNTMHSFFSKVSTPHYFGSGKNSGRVSHGASQIKQKQSTNLNADEASEKEIIDEQENEEEDEDANPDGDAKLQQLKDQKAKANVSYEKKNMLRKIEEKKQEEEEQLELCGEDFLFAVTQMLQDLDGVDLSQVENYGNTTSKQRKMLESGYSSEFSLMMHKVVDTEVPQKAIESFTAFVKRQAAFFNKVKKAGGPKLSENLTNDTKVSFFQECVKNSVLCLPILQKIIDHKLTLRCRTINLGHNKAIRVVLEAAPNLLHSLCLDQNGMDGDEMIEILTGLQSQSGSFKYLTIQNNTVDDPCIEQIINLVKRRLPDNLEELHLYFCKMSWMESYKFLQQVQNRCQLSSLSLVKANLNEFSMPYLEQIVKSQKRLTSLDISWNSLIPKTMKGLIEIISKNRRLQYINLSWNNIAASQQTEKEQQNVAEILGGAIKHNKNLIHFDLTCTGLTTLIVKELGTMLRRAGSLLSIHLSGNPGLTEENRDFLIKRIRCRPNEDIQRFNRIQQMLNDATKHMPNNFVDGIVAKVARDQAFEKTEFHPVDQLVLQRIIGFKEEQPGTGQWYESSPEAVPVKKHYKSECWICGKHVYSILLWSRGRAYRLSPIVKGSESKICYEIDRIEKLETDEDYNEDPGIGFVQGNLDYDQLNDKIPYLVGSFTGWRYKQMIPLHEFTQSLDQEYIDSFEMAKDEGYIRKKITEDQMTEREMAYLKVVEVEQRRRYRLNWAKIFKKYLKYKKPYLINGAQFDALDDDLDILDTYDENNRVYLDSSESEEEQKVQVVVPVKRKEKKRNDQGETEPEEEPMPVPANESKWDIVYCLPLFIKPGKHQYMIKYKNSDEKYQKKQLKRREKINKQLEQNAETPNEFQKQALDDVKTKLQAEIFFYNCQVFPREESIPIVSKSLQSKVVERQFNKETSVFKLWLKDTPQKTNDMFEQDFQYWKLYRFITKGPEVEIPAIQALFKQHADFIKECYVNLISTSSYPGINQMSFAGWVYKCKIPEGPLNMSTVDRLFIATNVSVAEKPKFETMGNCLCRFEFLEVLVRLAQNRYKDQGLAKSYIESLEKLFEEKVIPFAQPESWQGLREKEIWTIGVNDVLDANLDHLKKVYATYPTPTKKFMIFEDAISLCTKDSQLNISEKDILFCFGMSKMTIISESLNYKQYQFMQFVEFLEFICRLAHIKFKSSPEFANVPLAQKIEYILDDMLPGFGLVRNDVNIQVEENSESDDDY